MRTIISSERGKNELWITLPQKEEIFQNAQVVVTDYKKLEELKRKLRYLVDYKYLGKITREGFSTEKLVFTLDGAEKYSNDYLSTNYNPNKIYNGPTHEYEIEQYQNPRSETLRIITGNWRNNQELLWLFHHDNLKAIKESNFVELIISQLKQGLIDEETITKILKTVWPDFYTFATEGLSCIELDSIKKYHIEELRQTLTTTTAQNVLDETSQILQKEELAKRNTKVLELARKVNNI